jgi:hypothetical protein
VSRIIYRAANADMGARLQFEAAEGEEVSPEFAAAFALADLNRWLGYLIELRWPLGQSARKEEPHP